MKGVNSIRATTRQRSSNPLDDAFTTQPGEARTSAAERCSVAEEERKTELAARSADGDRQVILDPNPWPTSYTLPRRLIDSGISQWAHLLDPPHAFVFNQPMAERAQRSK
jgi:hypothetical protein